MRRTLLASLATTLLACGGATTTLTSDAGPGDGGLPDAGPADAGSFTPRFEPAPLPSGAVVHLVGRPAEGNAPATVEVWGRDLGPLFGAALHVELDPRLTVLSATPEPVLGPGAVSLVRLAPHDAALGLTRPSPDKGDVTIAEDTKLWTLLVTVDGAPSAAAVTPTRLVLRRASGAWTSAALAGGTFSLSEASR